MCARVRACAFFVCILGRYLSLSITKIAISEPKTYLTVPQNAVLFDQIGPYVLTVNQKGIVELKRVKLGPKEDKHIAIAKGIVDSDRVIVSGVEFATPGNEVIIDKAAGK